MPRWTAILTLMTLLLASGCPPPRPDDDDGAPGTHACESEVPGFPAYCVEVTDGGECPEEDDTKSLHEDTSCADLGYSWECPSGVWVIQGGSCL